MTWNQGGKEKISLEVELRITNLASIFYYTAFTMAKKEVKTDLRVYELLKDAKIPFSAQGSDIDEINRALKKGWSKAKTGKVWFPEYIAHIKDFLLVIEDKANINFHCKRNDQDLISQESKDIQTYAVNGALHYALHLAKTTAYTKIIAIGVSGDEKKHHISPIFVDERANYRELQEIETFICFSEDNIDEYYTKEILGESTDYEKTTEEIVADAKKLHEDLRNYGSLRDGDKPLVVAGILLALEEIKYKNFSLESLNWDTITTDGQKIFTAIEDNLRRANVSPDVKKDKILTRFASVIKDIQKINEIEPSLWKTPLKHYTEFLYKNIYQNIKYIKSSEDFLWRFYSEFMSYSGWDGQTLGIVLTPKHITELFCELVELSPHDKVFDPCCWTGGFLVSAMHKMLHQTEDENAQKNIKKEQLYGIELQPDMFTVATTNMILRGDGKSNLENLDFLKQNPAKLQLHWCNIGMMNPPYSQWSSANPDLYEIAFTEHLLNSIISGGKVIVIVPQSSFTGKTQIEKQIKANILKYHTLEWVITLNKNTFYGVGTNPCIAIFTAWEAHPKNKICKFINFENDGFEVQKHKWLVETVSAKDKKQHLLDVWFERSEAPTKFCVKTQIEADDERLHSFYYFNDEIPTQEEFEKTIADYLTFEFNMITHGRGYLFDNNPEQDEDKSDW